MGKPIITISEGAPGQVKANSVLTNQVTANILMQLAINYYQKAAIEKHEENKIKQGNIINPHTMQTISKKGN